MADQAASGDGGGSDFGPWIAGLSALGSLAGGFGGLFSDGGMSDGQKRDQRFLADFQMKQSLRNEEFQREQFERNSLTGRAAEAQRLGFHPLTALGINPSSGGGFGSSINMPADIRDSGSKWRSLSDMGQNLQRAASVMSTPAERAQEALVLRNQSLQNDLLETQVLNAKRELMRQPGTPPAQTTQTMHDSNGRPTIQPSEAFSAANAGSILGQAEWWIRNKGIPFFVGGGQHTPGYSNVPLVAGQVDNRDLNVIRRWWRDRPSAIRGSRMNDVERGYRNRP